MDDGISLLLNVLLILFLVLLNGVFFAFQIAIVKMKDSRLDELIEEGNFRAKIARRITANLDTYTLTAQLGIALSAIALGWVCGPATAQFLVEPVLIHFGASAQFASPVSIGIAYAGIVFFFVLLGILVPKSIAGSKVEGTSLWLSGLLYSLHKILYPVIWLLNVAANWIVRGFGIRPEDIHENTGHTEEEIRKILQESCQSGHIGQNELELVGNVFDFSGLVAREIMIPRTMFDCLYTNNSFEENLKIVQQKRQKRYPVVDEDKDHILGWVHALDVYDAALHDKMEKNILSFIRPLTVVPESMEINQVLKMIQNDRTHLVLVVDEYGGTSGLITIEYLLKGIVGFTHDEFRQERDELEVLNDRSSIDARMLIHDVNDLFQTNISNKEVDTIGGWVYSQFNEPPTIGQQLKVDGLTFTITEMEHLRIKRIEVNALPINYITEIEPDTAIPNVKAAKNAASPA